MIYPKFLKEQDYIGITSSSDGITNNIKIKRLEQAEKLFKDECFNIIETPNVRVSINGRAGTGKIRAQELESLVDNDKVSTIIFSSGGEFQMEMLPYFDFTKLVNNPKWLQGYSDPTIILYILTTKYDIATIYSDNIKSFGMIPLHKSLLNNLEILQGNIVTQTNFDYYESGYQDYITGYEPLKLDTKVKIDILTKEKELNIKGRIIGGCIDVINIIVGTKYDNTTNFIEKYKEDGIIWYFDNCELSSEEILRTLWKYKLNNYFKYCKCIIFGRPATRKSNLNISFEDSIKEVLKDLNIPIITGVDIGHVSPRMTIINGSIATIKVKENKLTISQELK